MQEDAAALDAAGVPAPDLDGAGWGDLKPQALVEHVSARAAITRQPIKPDNPVPI
jgi:hypothetical protein